MFKYTTYALATPRSASGKFYRVATFSSKNTRNRTKIFILGGFKSKIETFQYPRSTMSSETCSIRL